MHPCSTLNCPEKGGPYSTHWSSVGMNHISQIQTRMNIVVLCIKNTQNLMEKENRDRSACLLFFILWDIFTARCPGSTSCFLSFFCLKSWEITPRMTYSNKGPGDQCLAWCENPVFEMRPSQNIYESGASPGLWEKAIRRQHGKICTSNSSYSYTHGVYCKICSKLLSSFVNMEFSTVTSESCIKCLQKAPVAFREKAVYIING